MGKKAKITDLLNRLTFKVLYDRFHNLALNMFEWEGLPPNMKGRYIENALYEHGQALFFEDNKIGKMVLPCSVDGGFNVYGEGVRYRVWGYNGYTNSLNTDNSVLIRNNHLKTPTQDIIMLYTNKLYEIERTLDVNVKTAKHPYVMLASDKTILSLKNIYNEIDGNSPVIFPNKELNLDGIDVLETKAELITTELSDYRHDVLNETLSILGINNANTDKKERLITDEVQANNEYINENIDFMLETRQQACVEINSMFGLNVSVKIKNEKQEVNNVDLDGGTEGTGGE